MESLLNAYSVYVEDDFYITVAPELQNAVENFHPQAAVAAATQRLTPQYYQAINAVGHAARTLLAEHSPARRRLLKILMDDFGATMSEPRVGADAETEP